MSGASEILTQKVSYSGAGISVRGLEEDIQQERSVQNRHVRELQDLRGQNETLQTALTEEIAKLKALADELHRERKGAKFGLRRLLAKLPFARDRILSHRSVESLLRQQYELSAQRLKEATEFADRLSVAKAELYDELERQGARIVESAQDAKLAAARVLELNSALDDARMELASADHGAVKARELEVLVDQLERDLGEHSARLKLYETAEERIDRLRDNTRQLAKTISQLSTDMAFYITTASEKLDLIAGQIQAVGAAADASLVLLELQSSLDSLTDSINHTTRFVSETQAYFREIVDRMVENLQLYDEETERVLAKNLAMNELDKELRMAEALTMAIATQDREGAPE